MPPNFDAPYSNPPNQGLGGFYDPTAYTDNTYAQDKSFNQTGAAGAAATGNEFDDEPPLLEGKLTYTYSKSKKYWYVSNIISKRSTIRYTQ